MSGAIGSFAIGQSAIGGVSAYIPPTLGTTYPVPVGTTTAFAPNTQTTFQFQATLDGTVYNVVVTWNVTGQRWYVNVYGASNTLILALPLIGSPPDYPISITAGYFASTLVFYEATQTFVVSP